MPTVARRSSPWFFALALALVVVLVPEVADACPVCNATKNESSRIAFLVTTGFLSLLPLAMVAGVLWWMRSAIRSAEQQDPS